MDLVASIHRRLAQQPYATTPIHALYRDEVQDFCQAELLSDLRCDCGGFLCTCPYALKAPNCSHCISSPATLLASCTFEVIHSDMLAHIECFGQLWRVPYEHMRWSHY